LAGIGGAGGQGIIVITYTPTAATTVVSDAPNPAEFLASPTAGNVTGFELLAAQGNNLPASCEFMVGARSDPGISAELLSMSRADGWLPDELLATASGDPRMRLEWAAVLNSLLVLPIALGGGVARDRSARIEWSAQVFSDRYVAAEWLASLPWDLPVPTEFAALVARDAPGRTEWLSTTIVPLTADAFLAIEWSEAPAPVPVRVSLERLLVSPGNRRILSTLGRLRLLKHL